MSYDPAVTDDLAGRHRETLEQALAAIRKRDYYSAYPESPSPRVYGETAAADGKAAFEAWLGSAFPLDHAGCRGHGGAGAVAVRLRPRRWRTRT